MKETLREQIQDLAAGLVSYADSEGIATLARLEKGIPARGFAGLAQRLRGWSASRAWVEIRAEQIHDRVPQVALCCLSAHPNGRVRQACVQMLDDRPENLRWLLLRANDWHLPLGVLASARLLGLLQANTADWWLPYLTLVQGYGRGYVEGGQMGPVLAQMASVAKDHPEVFESFLREPNHPPETLRQAAAMLKTYHPDRAMRVAAISSDVVLRALALRGSDDPQHWRAAFRDPVPSMRVEALEKLWGADHELLKEALFDRAASVRETAKFLARKAQLSETVAQLYREGPPGTAKFDGAIGVIPPAELEGWLQSHLDHPERALRKAAQLAFDRFRPKEAEELWWTMARTHPDADERRLARRLLRARRSKFLTWEQLETAIGQSEPTIAAELRALAEVAPCPFTRLCAHLHGLAHWPERWTKSNLDQTLERLSQALPPYRLEPENRARLASLIAKLPENEQPQLAAWLHSR